MWHVGRSLKIDAEAISRVTGAFYNKEKKFLEATGFILRPDKRIETAAYSSGPGVRLVANNVLRIIKHFKSIEKKRGIT